jgi:hypothetical protein
MPNNLLTDGCTRSKSDNVAVLSVRPALADISGAINYLGKPSRSKFYADILPLLDVVKLGARTMVTIESLDRLIAADQRATVA